MSLRRLFDRLEKFLRRVLNREKKTAPPGPTFNLSAFRGDVMAKDVIVTWILPTVREDNSALPLAEIKHTLVQVRVSGSTLPWTTVSTVPPIGPQSVTLADQAKGLWNVRTIVVDTGDRRTPDDKAQTVSFEVEPEVPVIAPPGPTTGLTAAVQP